MVKIDLKVENVKLLTNDDGQKPIAIGHLRESGSLKT